jgi:hypothetical protein
LQSSVNHPPHFRLPGTFFAEATFHCGSSVIFPVSSPAFVAEISSGPADYQVLLFSRDRANDARNFKQPGQGPLSSAWKLTACILNSASIATEASDSLSWDARMALVFDPLPENADSPISHNAELVSNITVSSDLHCENHGHQSILTLRGRTIEPLSFACSHAASPIRCQTESDSNATLSRVCFARGQPEPIHSTDFGITPNTV